MTPRTLYDTAASLWWLPPVARCIASAARQWQREQAAAAENLIELEEARADVARLTRALDEIVENARQDARMADAAPNVVAFPRRESVLHVVQQDGAA